MGVYYNFLVRFCTLFSFFILYVTDSLKNWNDVDVDGSNLWSSARKGRFMFVPICVILKGWKTYTLKIA